MPAIIPVNTITHNAGDASWIFAGTTTGATPVTVPIAVLSPNTTVNFSGYVIAREAATTDSAGWQYEGLAKQGVAVAAAGVLSFTNAVSNNQTVTIGTTVYTFKTTLTDGPGYVLIGANYDASAANLVAAINRTGTPGVQYSTSIVAHPDVTASYSTPDLTVTAKVAGAAGNSIALDENITNASWDDVNMTTGADAATSTAIVDSITPTATGADAGAATWAMDVIANTTLGSIDVEFTGEAAHTIDWICVVSTLKTF